MKLKRTRRTLIFADYMKGVFVLRVLFGWIKKKFLIFNMGKVRIGDVMDQLNSFDEDLIVQASPGLSIMNYEIVYNLKGKPRLLLDGGAPGKEYTVKRLKEFLLVKMKTFGNICISVNGGNSFLEKRIGRKTGNFYVYLVNSYSEFGSVGY
ncbi:MAG: hypothetical protein GY821_12670 [Gammaproteobacteria bacterium]|nr:hypothetical protein [Gammaproteobacteria bacterium]